MPFDAVNPLKYFINVCMCMDIGVMHTYEFRPIPGVITCLCFASLFPPFQSCLNQKFWLMTTKHVNFFALARPKHVYTLKVSVQHVHASRWACACSWACTHFQWSICTLIGKNVHTGQLSICTLTLQHAHTFSWACACFQLSMCTLSGEHVHTSSWACAYF